MNELEVKVVKYPDRKNLVLRWIDPDTGNKKTKSAKTTRRREAERKAAKLEADLKAGLLSGPPAVTWQEFKQAYQDDCLSSLSDATFSTVGTTFMYVEKILKPKLLKDLTGAAIATWQTKQRAEGLAEATIGIHSRHLKASLRWAHDMELLEVVPKINMPKKSRAAKMKGRAVTLEEFERMLIKVGSIVGDEATPSWQRFLNGLWLSGLRISEAVTLSWDSDDKVSVCLDNKSPCFRFRSGGQKSGRVELVPMAPDFANMLLAVPVGSRHGRVFKLMAHSGSKAIMGFDWISKTVTRIGEAANVVVERTTRKGQPHIKFASSHDFRRAFGLRWSKLVMPPVLMQLMRHQDIKTTMQYYIGKNVQDASDQLQAALQGQDALKSNISVPCDDIKENVGEADSLKTSSFTASN
jgi:integrase